jgi:hypothetical protein
MGDQVPTSIEVSAFEIHDYALLNCKRSSAVSDTINHSPFFRIAISPTLQPSFSSVMAYQVSFIVNAARTPHNRHFLVSQIYQQPSTPTCSLSNKKQTGKMIWPRIAPGRGSNMYCSRTFPPRSQLYDLWCKGRRPLTRSWPELAQAVESGIEGPDYRLNRRIEIVFMVFPLNNSTRGALQTKPGPITSHLAGHMWAL